MKLLLDEMHSPTVAEVLEGDGVDVVAVLAEESLRSLSDDALLEHAADEDRAVVTENLRDFTRLAKAWAHDGRDHAGIILTHRARFVRSVDAYEGRLITALRSFVADPPVTGSSWVWWLQ